MSLIPKELQADLDHLRHRVQELGKTPIPEEAMTDAIGQLEHIQSMLRKEVSNLKAEADPMADGDEYVWINGGKNDYSFNLPSIVAKAIEASGDPAGEVLADMVEEGVLKVSGVRALEAFQAKRPSMTLLTVNSKVTDGDYGEIGKVWRDGWRLTGKEVE